MKMWEYNQTNELQHFGIKGMKWGVTKKVSDKISNYRKTRKEKELAYRKKLKNIRNNKHTIHEVKQRAQYRNQSLAGRVVGQGIAATAGTMIGEALRGNISRYKYMNRQQLQQHFTKLAAKTAVKTVAGVALKDALAKSASDRYNDDGTFKEGAKKQGIFTKENKIETAVKLAAAVTPVIAGSAAISMTQARAERAANEARFNSWGGRILQESASNYVYGNYKVQ